ALGLRFLSHRRPVRCDFATSFRPLDRAHRSASQHEIIVGRPLIRRHDELVVQPEEVEANPSETLGQNYIAKPDLPYQRIGTLRASIDANVCNRIEIPELKNVRARLTIDPQHRWLIGDTADDIAKPLRARMKRDTGHNRTEGHCDDRRAMPAQIR